MIKPTCRFCKIELQNFGGILFSPPKDDVCEKLHVCADCYIYLKDLAEIGVKQNKGYAKP